MKKIHHNTIYLPDYERMYILCECYRNIAYGRVGFP